MTAPLVVRAPAWELFIRGVNVTGQIAPDVTEISFVDKLHGESDELAVTIEDRDDKWMGPWYPQKGDKLDLKLGYAGESLIKVGTFELDEPHWRFPPRVVVLNGIAAPVTSALRTARSAGYEAQTLRAIAEKIAQRHGLTIQGVIKPISIDRATQAGERDLEFLKRLADRYGYVVTVRGTDLVFSERAQIQTEGPKVGTLGPSTIRSAEFTDKATQVYRAAIVTYHDAGSGARIEGRAGDSSASSADTLRITQRVESQKDAERLAFHRLALSKLAGQSGSIAIEGNPKYLAGVRFGLEGCGRLSGVWQVRQSTHRLTRSEGYTTTLEVNRVG